MHLVIPKGQEPIANFDEGEAGGTGVLESESTLPPSAPNAAPQATPTAVPLVAPTGVPWATPCCVPSSSASPIIIDGNSPDGHSWVKI